MTDKPMKTGRKYVDSGFVHDMMDTVNADHYLVRAHVWPSMRTELPHNVIVVISVNSGAVLHASCEPCRASSLGHCSHVVAVLFSVLDYVQNHGPVLAQHCTSQECSWNKGKKRNKNPRRVSQAKYPSKKRQATLPVIDFDPRPANKREIKVHHINNFLSNIQALSQEDGGLSMWETQLQFTYYDYDLQCDRNSLLLEQTRQKTGGVGCEVKGGNILKMDTGRVESGKIMIQKVDISRVEGGKKMTMDASRVEGGKIMKDGGVVAESGGRFLIHCNDRKMWKKGRSPQRPYNQKNHTDYTAMSNREVLKQVAQLLHDKSGRTYHRCANQSENEWLVRWLCGYLGWDNSRSLSACIYNDIRTRHPASCLHEYAMTQERS
ncbi:hypothetical protein OS493_029339 [Desmophyllum pertusum]|uniref:SWIM-type domain-containing protein n=1 Tax=Desmophyllum pertusum TaxID=174260 RepID=A0A9W9Z9D4_9CNID|nr:hypothetical protein OS493_029339 [Desmophyllum pertusum]